jgi:hypothetical protein
MPDTSVPARIFVDIGNDGADWGNDPIRIRGKRGIEA